MANIITKGIFIPGQVMSKKNAKQIFSKSMYSVKKGRQVTVPFISSSKQYKAWVKSVEWIWIQHRQKWLDSIKGHELPLIIGMHFVRKDKSKFDFNNMSQGIMDEIQKAQWIPGDDIANIFAVPVANEKGEIFSIDPKAPGVYLIAIKELDIKI